MTLVIDGPALMQMPPKLYRMVELFNQFRFFLIEGGRGGGKTQAVGRFVTMLADQARLRITCGREIQNSIEESVYTVFKDIIANYQLPFDVLSKGIIHKSTGSNIIFKGFREQGAVSIKGLEGVDILWIDESQSITKNTLDVILPTIRKSKSKVFFTMNRYLKNDAVYREFINRPDCLHIKINFDENPFCPDVLKHEAQICLENHPDDYPHIWLGEPREEADDYLFNHKELECCKNVDFIDKGETPDIILALDIARYGGDKCVGVVLERMTGVKFRVAHIERWGKKDLMETTGRVMEMRRLYHPNITVIDSDGLGAGVHDRLVENGVPAVEFRAGQRPQSEASKSLYLNRKTESYYKLKDMISRGILQITQESLLEELSTIRFKIDSSEKHSIVRKEEMKKRGIKSPDEADALMMAVSEIENIGRSNEVSRDRPQSHQPAYSPKQPVLSGGRTPNHMNSYGRDVRFM